MVKEFYVNSEIVDRDIENLDAEDLRFILAPKKNQVKIHLYGADSGVEMWESDCSAVERFDNSDVVYKSLCGLDWRGEFELSPLPIKKLLVLRETSHPSSDSLPKEAHKGMLCDQCFSAL